jgi:hypothetical protein
MACPLVEDAVTAFPPMVVALTLDNTVAFATVLEVVIPPLIFAYTPSVTDWVAGIEIDPLPLKLYTFDDATVE